MNLTQAESNDLRQQAADIVDQLRRGNAMGQLHMLEIQVKRAVEELEMQDAIRMVGVQRRTKSELLFVEKKPRNIYEKTRSSF